MRLAHWAQYPEGKDEGNVNCPDMILLDTETFGKTKAKKCRVCAKAYDDYKEHKK